MGNSFLDLKESETADEIYGQVIHSNTFIKVRYKYNNTPFYVEFPKVEQNAHLKEGDEIEMALYLLKEIEDET